jgi:hypothetical protein
MTRYADPLVCPDCRGTIEYGVPSCPHCELPLRGATAQLLYSTLLRADQLIDQLRAAPRVQPVLVGASPTSVPWREPARDPEPRASRLEATSIPKILLGLGALCLLVAAMVFLAVAWSSLGMGGRTAVLLMLTSLAGGAVAWLAGRSLRAGAESFAVVLLGLVALDVTGAENAGWLGHHGDAGFALILGGVVAVAGFALARLGLESKVGRLVGAEIVTVLGATTCGAALLGVLPDAAGALTATLASAAVAGVARRTRLNDLATGLGLLAGLWWLGLVAVGIDEAVAAPTAGQLWGELRVWPLLVAGLLAALPALASSLSDTIRSGAASVAALVATGAATIIVVGNPLDQVAATAGVVLALTTLAVWRLLVAWQLTPVPTLAPAAVGTIFFIILEGGRAASRLGFDPWSVSLDHHVLSYALPIAGWLLLPLVAALVAAAWVGADLAGESLPWSRILTVVVPLTVAGTIASYDVPLWAPFAVLLLGTLTAFAVELLGDSTATIATAIVGATALGASAPSTWLTLAALAVLTCLSLALDLLEDEARAHTHAARMLLPILLGGFVGTVGELAAWPTDWQAIAVLATVGLLALWRSGPVLEAGAALTGLVTVAAQAPDLTWLAVDLTVAGVLVTASSLVHGRRDLGWAGGALLMAATWARLADLEVTTVEAYTLPLATALVLVALWRMWRTDLPSLQALSPGLVLATVPTLLQVLADPVSDRAVLLGGGCLVLVLVGVGLRWGGPLVVGAAVGGLEVLREATYASVLPQWVLIALVGGMLTAIGVTWEQRLRDLRLAAGYVRALR